MTIIELLAKRARTWETAKAFLESRRNKDGILSAEDDAVYSRMEQEISDLGREIARLERQGSTPPSPPVLSAAVRRNPLLDAHPTPIKRPC